MKPESAAEYPQIYRKDTAEFPQLIEEVEDESDVFVLDETEDEIYKADEFFASVLMLRFTGEVIDSNHPDQKWPK